MYPVKVWYWYSTKCRNECLRSKSDTRLFQSFFGDTVATLRASLVQFWSWLVRPGAVSRSHTFSNCSQSPRCDLLNVADAWHLKNCTTSENFCGQKCNLFDILQEETTTTPNFSFELWYQEQGQNEWKSYHPPTQREPRVCLPLSGALPRVHTPQPHSAQHEKLVHSGSTVLTQA